MPRSPLNVVDNTLQELKIVLEDEHIIVVDKPSGVLSVPSEPEAPSLAQVVFERCCQNQPLPLTDDFITSMGQMVVHRLGMDTSGLIVLAKTLPAVRGMNELFRTRKITRQYEALVCGHIRNEQGLISLPLMRDYEYPPYMRVSTDKHQRALSELDPDVVGRKLLEAPKASLTHYQGLSREMLMGQDDLPVTRLALTSISGRTHQLNVHCAAFGHPIVRDTVYGYKGSAAPNGGLDESERLSPDRVDQELQRRINDAAKAMNMCVHAKLIRFQHPVTDDNIELVSRPPF